MNGFTHTKCKCCSSISWDCSCSIIFHIYSGVAPFETTTKVSLQLSQDYNSCASISKLCKTFFCQVPIWWYVWKSRETNRPAVMRGTRSVMYIRRAAERLVVPSSQISLHSPPTALSSSDWATKARGITYTTTLAWCCVKSGNHDALWCTTISHWFRSGHTK